MTKGDHEEEAASSSLVKFLLNRLDEPGKGVRVEDAISSAASIVAWRCIDASGDYDPRTHQFAPGERVLSTNVNKLFFGDDDRHSEGTPDSIVGILRDRLIGHGYAQADFPEPRKLMVDFVSRIGDPSDWGGAPLSVPAENRPTILPLKIEFETRAPVDQLLASLKGDRLRCLAAATLALADILLIVAQKLDHRIALLLALETVNGMAKTRPMTQEYLSRFAPTAPVRAELPETIQAQLPRLREQSAQVSTARDNLAEEAGGLSLVEDAEAIARLYRRLVLLIGVQILMGLVVQLAANPEGEPGLAVLVLLVSLMAIAATINLVVTTYKLARRLKAGPPLLWAIALFIPCVNIFGLLALSSSAQSWCRRHGVKVGLLGPTKESIEELRRLASPPTTFE
jgi:hypothetical protein